jgi:hypothetical protein
MELGNWVDFSSSWKKTPVCAKRNAPALTAEPVLPDQNFE